MDSIYYSIGFISGCWTNGFFYWNQHRYRYLLYIYSISIVYLDPIVWCFSGRNAVRKSSHCSVPSIFKDICSVHTIRVSEFVQEMRPFYIYAVGIIKNVGIIYRICIWFFAGFLLLLGIILSVSDGLIIGPTSGCGVQNSICAELGALSVEDIGFDSAGVVPNPIFAGRDA